MKRKLLLIISLLLNFKNMSYAIIVPTVKPNTLNLSTKKKGELKFGLETDDILSLLLSDKVSKVGIFAEHKFNGTLGMRIGLLYTQDTYFLNLVTVSYQNAIYFNSRYIEAKCISFPILLRFYLENNQNFCLFSGVQLGYVISGKVAFTPRESRLEKVKIDLKNINEQDKVRRFQCSIILGYEYEWDFGLFYGLSNTKELINIVEFGQWTDNWKLNASLGYNFGKLL